MEKVNAEQPSAGTAVDPVCGMKVERSTARFKDVHAGKEYFFCSAGCLTKFQANPTGVLASGPKGMGSGGASSTVGSSAAGGSGLVSIGVPSAPKPTAAKAAAGRDARAHIYPTYVCPMCAEVRQIGPGPCP